MLEVENCPASAFASTVNRFRWRLNGCHSPHLPSANVLVRRKAKGSLSSDYNLLMTLQPQVAVIGFREDSNLVWSQAVVMVACRERERENEP